ncbi:hypothetical protein R70723_27890 [Paenibacillus sp. FSL R7-0273]|uniref:hypothetical protein n=1 Tax=Paenibacillus sp. FSL R7-0273 TaxID=1536772 RepID=UPI0004F8B18B|nr:hypothetical protein [Paenibacillus sp. FSL R7-0273]AIQ49290.1 hypothetical protein R70723_27890 [Paenibacillus sp. FSL R7-0273]OMF88031.1 hypothetical protein BK144_22790 [Paenibacillus sp. FSL R7-0273]
MMKPTREYLVDQYIQLSSCLYPSMAIKWGIDRQELFIFSEDNLHRVMAEYKKLLGLAELLEEGSQKPIQSLTRTLKLRIFELEELQSWRTPVFYIQHSLRTISLLGRTYEAVFSADIRSDLLAAYIRSLQPFYAAAVRNLSEASVTKLDCILGLRQLEEELKQILLMAGGLSLPDGTVEMLKQEAEKFRAYLISRQEESITFMRGIGEERFRTYIALESGIRMDFQRFLKDMETEMDEYDCTTDISRNAAGERSKVLSLEAQLEHVFHAGKALMEADTEEFLQHVATADMKDLKYKQPGRLAYLRSYLLKEKAVKGALIYDPAKLNDFSMTLGLVHEIFPGHHYSKFVQSRENMIESTVMDNLIIEEGWAKYCEYSLSHFILQDADLIAEFRQGLRKSLLLAISTVLIHSCGYSFNQAADRLAGYCEGRESASRLRSICLQAYSAPIESISYALGFAAVRAGLKKHEHITDDDFLDLFRNGEKLYEDITSS